MSAGGDSIASIAVVYHSTWGHMTTLVRAFEEGARSEGVDVEVRRAPELLDEETRSKMGAAPHAEDHPVVERDGLGDWLEKSDGVVWGVATRFGAINANIKAVIDGTGSLWSKGALMGKPTSILFGTGTLGGGQETTALTTLIPLVHHGMIYVPLGYPSKAMFDTDTIHGGGPWGSGYYAGADGSRPVSEAEKALAKLHGTLFAKQVIALKKGREAVAKSE